MTNALIEQIEEDVELQAELEELLANRPQFVGDGGEVDPDLEPGKRRHLISSAVEMTLYNIETGEPSQVIFDALGARMRQRFPADHPNPKFAGKRVYTRKAKDAPAIVRGTLACPLSAAGDRSEAIAFGFPNVVCPKPAYFNSEYDVELHVEKSHKRFYRIRNEKRWRDEQRERDAKQDKLIEAVLAGRTSIEDVSHGKSQIESIQASAVLTCDCGWTTSPTSKNPAASLRMHQKHHKE